MVDAERAALSRPRCTEQWGRMCYDTVKRWLTVRDEGGHPLEPGASLGNDLGRTPALSCSGREVSRDRFDVPKRQWTRQSCATEIAYGVRNSDAFGPGGPMPARFHDLLTSPALTLCHERTSDHWSDLVRSRGDGLSFSAHGACNRAAT